MKKFVIVLVLVSLVMTAMAANAELRVEYGRVVSRKVGYFHNGNPIYDHTYYVGIHSSDIDITYEIEVTKDEYEKEVGRSFDESLCNADFEYNDTYQYIGAFGKNNYVPHVRTATRSSLFFQFAG